MGRLHSNGKGISASAIPYSRTPPSWLKLTPDAVVEQICKLAKKGATPSQIGVVLRDSHGVAQVKVVTGKKRMGFRCYTGDASGGGPRLTCNGRKQDPTYPQIERYGGLYMKTRYGYTLYGCSTLRFVALMPLLGL